MNRTRALGGILTGVVIVAMSETDGAATPTFAPDGGRFLGSVGVTISCATALNRTVGQAVQCF